MNHMDQYQVTGACAIATTATPHGQTKVMFMRDSFLPPDVPQVEIDHLLASKLITKVGTVPDPVVEPAADPGGDGGGTGNEPDAAAEAVAKARAEAKAKLPEDGSLPHPNAGHPVWVEAAVAKGYSYEEAVKQDKAELVALLKA